MVATAVIEVFTLYVTYIHTVCRCARKVFPSFQAGLGKWGLGTWEQVAHMRDEIFSGGSDVCTNLY